MVQDDNKQIDEEVTKKMNLIIQKSFENSGNLPSITQDSKDFVDGCYPFKIQANLQEISKSYFSFFGLK